MMAVKKNNTYFLHEHSSLRNICDEKIELAKKRAFVFLENEDLEKYDIEKGVTFSLGVYTQKVRVLSLQVKSTKKGNYSYSIVSENINDVDYIVYQKEWDRFKKEGKL